MRGLTRLLVFTTVLAACDGFLPTTACACTPPGLKFGVIAGSVVDQSDAPIVGALVFRQLLPDGQCNVTATPVSQGQQETLSIAPDGRFQFTLAWVPGTKCWRLWAVPPHGTTLTASDSSIATIDFSDDAPDVVELTLRLRASS